MKAPVHYCCNIDISHFGSLVHGSFNLRCRGLCWCHLKHSNVRRQSHPSSTRTNSDYIWICCWDRLTDPAAEGLCFAVCQCCLDQCGVWILSKIQQQNCSIVWCVLSVPRCSPCVWHLNIFRHMGRHKHRKATNHYDSACWTNRPNGPPRVTLHDQLHQWGAAEPLQQPPYGQCTPYHCWSHSSHCSQDHW